ncbi:MAG: hypothetical protein CMQ19_03430 [Gammaproteobacteria bacterium]|nr:hypothetical protein [Gammaproteobacteria bacterium]
MTRTKAVLFDMAGTVVSMGIFDDHQGVVASEFARILGLDDFQNEMVASAFTGRGATNAKQNIFQQDFYLFRDIFAVRYAVAAKELGFKLTRSDTTMLSDMWWKGCIAKFQELGLHGGGLRKGAIDTLQTLRESGFNVGLVSNLDEGDFQDFLSVDNFASYFDFHLSSEAAQSCKPDAAIFDLALEQAGCTANEVVFVGDTPTQDIDGAAAAGMQTVLIHEELKQATRDMNSTHKPDHEINELPELLEIIQGL